VVVIVKLPCELMAAPEQTAAYEAGDTVGAVVGNTTNVFVKASPSQMPVEPYLNVGLTVIVTV
jgi:hypothetical protein